VWGFFLIFALPQYLTFLAIGDFNSNQHRAETPRGWRVRDSAAAAWRLEDVVFGEGGEG
jgi:hypothetical protein